MGLYFPFFLISILLQIVQTVFFWILPFVSLHRDAFVVCVGVDTKSMKNKVLDGDLKELPCSATPPPWPTGASSGRRARRQHPARHLGPGAGGRAAQGHRHRHRHRAPTVHRLLGELAAVAYGAGPTGAIRWARRCSRWGCPRRIDAAIWAPSARWRRSWPTTAATWSTWHCASSTACTTCCAGSTPGAEALKRYS